jgi:cell division protein YceG involved in septum cleavage
VVVPPGATSGEVARLLRGKSLIADEGEFLRIAAGRQAEKRFLPGTYRFASDITVKGLIDALLTGPEAE